MLLRLPALLIGVFMTVALVSIPARAATIQDIFSPKGIKAWLVEDYTVPVISMNIAFEGGAAQDLRAKARPRQCHVGLLDEGAALTIRAPSRLSWKPFRSTSPRRRRGRL